MKLSLRYLTLLTGFVFAASSVQSAPGLVKPVAFVTDTGSAARVESGSLLRIFSQQIAASACFFYNGVKSDLSADLLTEAREGFDVHLAALRDGDETLGIIGGEERRKTRLKLDNISEVWSGIAQAADALLVASNNTDAVGVIKDQNMVLFGLTDTLASDLQGQYSDPIVLMQSDILTIEIVGRQAMMTQKIAKNACKIWSGRDTPEVRDHLNKAMSIYEASLGALLNGMPEVSLKAAPTPEIASDLKQISADWQEVRPTIDAIMNGSSSQDDLIFLFQHMADEMHKLEDVTHKYVVLTQRDY